MTAVEQEPPEQQPVKTKRRTTEASTPEEIANAWLELPPEQRAECGAQIRSYGDRRYCEARDAAARVAEDMAAGWVPGQGREASIVAEAIRKLTPEAKP